MARLSVDDEFFGEEFVEALGTELKINKFEARGRLMTLWWHAINELRPVVDHRQLAVWFGWPISKSGELSASLVLTDWVTAKADGFEIRGVRKYMGWYAQKKKAAPKGGQARADAERDERGRFLPKDHPTSSRSAGEIHPTSSPPAPALAPELINKRESSETMEPEEPEIDLWPLAEAFPSTIGQDIGLELLRPQIKSKGDFDDCLRAIQNYKSEINRNSKRTRYDFDVWVRHDWRGKWLPVVKKVAQPPPPPPREPEAPSRPLSEILKGHPDLEQKLAFIRSGRSPEQVTA